MPIKVEGEDGKEIEAFTPEEVKTQIETAVAETKTTLEKTIEEKETEKKGIMDELDKVKKLNIDKTKNFQRYNEMSEETKKTYDTNTLELLKRLDSVQDELSSTQTKLTEKEKKDGESAKSSSLAPFHKGDAELQKKLETNYSFLSGMPETTPEEVRLRAEAAAKLTGIVIDARNPLYTPYNGEAPKYDDKKEYTETAEGKTAADLVRQALNIKAPK